MQTQTTADWIQGEPGDALWTRQIYRRSTRLENPLRQLERHSGTLASAPGIPAEHFHPVVTFVGDTAFNRGLSFVDYIRSFETLIFSEHEVMEMAQRLDRAASRQPWRHAGRRLGCAS
ncbi:nuclease-related domain-containing protein [Thiocystis violascens]|uniref:nuclease-related domain-containing protein n=1 Tax=Thiocystis violascens TaxID=73141 RepID=UPI00022C2DA3|nr:nuclease-related domain-containing protein [Thiocystis violascens]